MSDGFDFPFRKGIPMGTITIKASPLARRAAEASRNFRRAWLLLGQARRPSLAPGREGVIEGGAIDGMPTLRRGRIGGPVAASLE